MPLLLPLMFFASSVPSGSVLGADVCELVENLPGKKDKIRQLKVYRAGFVALDRANGQVKKLSKARRILEKRTHALLEQARRVFQEKNDKVKRRAVRRFLDKHVYSTPPALLLRDEGFELPASVSTTLAWLRCREGKFREAIAYARPGHLEPGSLIAFAAILLMDQGRNSEALELLPRLGEEGFLSPFVQAEFTTDSQERLRFHRMAQLRAMTQGQRKAIRAQRQRHPSLKGP